MKRISGSSLAAAAATLMIAPALWAHPGHGAQGFAAGLAHPLTGVDHIAAMVAVGLWAVQLGKRAVWMVPLAFVGMMIAGAGLAFAGVSIPFSEQGIAASVLVLGLLIVFAMRMPVWAGMMLVGVFAVFHGWAHGHEMHAEMSAATFGVGFVIATAMLHAAGIGLGLLLGQLKAQDLVRLTGVALMICAALLFAGVL